MDLDDGMLDVPPIQAIDVERFNELNLSLLQTTEYAARYLSNDHRKLNAFQEMQHLQVYDNLPKEPLANVQLDAFFRKSGLKLNKSQCNGVRNLDYAVSFVEGPPGTGKTTVITKMVCKALACGKGVLVLGQTNFSVKQVYDSLVKNNICEKKS